MKLIQTQTSFVDFFLLIFDWIPSLFIIFKHKNTQKQYLPKYYITHRKINCCFSIKKKTKKKRNKTINRLSQFRMCTHSIRQYLFQRTENKNNSQTKHSVYWRFSGKVSALLLRHLLKVFEKLSQRSEGLKRALTDIGQACVCISNGLLHTPQLSFFPLVFI